MVGVVHGPGEGFCACAGRDFEEENMSLLSQHPRVQKNVEPFCQYQSCLNFLKNKPQINADERRLNLCVLCGEQSIMTAFESSKNDEPCLSILSSILSRHLFNRTYSPS